MTTFWAINPTNSTVLLDNTGNLAHLTLDGAVLHTLPSTAYVANPQTNAHCEYFVAIEALVALGVLTSHPANPNALVGQGAYFETGDYRQLLHLDPVTLGELCYGIQALKWADDHRFCTRCGTPLHPHKSELAKVCPACSHRHYPKIQPCVIVAILKDKQILLAQHHRHKDGMYGLIAGFVEVGETLEQAVAREVAEETGLTVKNIRYIASQAWPYPSNLMLGFVADWADGQIVIDKNELTDARFFEFNNLPKIPNVGTIARQLIEITKEC